MPHLSGFSGNGLQTKNDFSQACEALLRPLVPHFSSYCAKIKIPVTSGAHFDDNAAQLEGYARPLWLVAALLSDPDATTKDDGRRPLLQPWIDGLRHGVDPASPEYWGEIGDWDQRMVEAEIISFALLTAPEAFYNPLSAESKEQLATWLKGLNGKVMPENNWRFFRVLSNLALIKACGVPQDSVWPDMKQDLETLELFYISDGWSADGIWRRTTEQADEEGTGTDAVKSRQADYYSGSFALQFSQMLYSKHAEALDPVRAALYKDRARQFIRGFWTYFDTDGAAIPFGRSLTYRFAMGAFYAAFAYAGLCDDSDPLLSHGAVKGMLFRHLRFWTGKSEGIFWPDGTFNIGYMYPNMYMSEDYNSPQSPYWALKSLIVAALPASHPFWRAEELPHPLARGADGSRAVTRGVNLIKPARQIVSNHPDGRHHFMLSSGQFAVWPMKATQAKYAKFAYSSAFGFSVPTGNLITQIAPDSALALSRDGGETWAVRWTSIGDTEFVKLPVNGTNSTNELATGLVSRWKPWQSQTIEIETTLIPPCDQWPDWHVRVHRIRPGRNGVEARTSFTTVEGGFAIDGRRRSDGRYLWKDRLQANSEIPLSSAGFHGDEGALETPTSSFVISKAGASGVVDISPVGHSGIDTIAGEVLKPDPNTNLMTPRTVLPTVKRSSTKWSSDEIILSTAIFAVSFNGEPRNGVLADIEARWARVPKISRGQDGQLSLS